MSPVQGVRAGPLPWAKIPVRVHVLRTRTPCILQVVYSRRIASCVWCINCLLMVRPTCMTTCRQGQWGCRRAREWGGGGGRAVPVTRAVAIALTWATTDDGQEAYFQSNFVLYTHFESNPCSKASMFCYWYLLLMLPSQVIEISNRDLSLFYLSIVILQWSRNYT